MSWNAIAADDAPLIAWFAPGETIGFSETPDETSIELAMNGGVMVPLETPFRAPMSGMHVLAVSRRDESGNVSPPTWLRIGIDAEPPNVSIHLSAKPVSDDEGIFWVPGDADAWVEASDDQSGIADASIVCAGCPESSGEREGTPLGDDGSVVLRAWAVDKVGNRAEAEGVDLSIDSRPPRGECSVDGPRHRRREALFISPKTVIKADLVDSDSGLVSRSWIRDGQEVTPQDWHNPLPEGAHRLTIVAADLVGNHFQTPQLAFITDATPPRITWEFVNPPFRDSKGKPWYPKGRAIIKPAAQDAGAGLADFTWTIDGIVPEDGSRWERVDGTISVACESVHFKAVDQVGNAAIERVEIGYDQQAPSIELRTRDEKVVTPRAAWNLQTSDQTRVAFQDAGCGIAKRSYLINDGTWATYPGKVVEIDGRKEARMSVHGHGSPPTLAYIPRPPDSGGRLTDHVVFSRPGFYWVKITCVDHLGHEESRTYFFEVSAVDTGGTP